MSVAQGYSDTLKTSVFLHISQQFIKRFNGSQMWFCPVFSTESVKLFLSQTAAVSVRFLFLQICNSGHTATQTYRPTVKVCFLQVLCQGDNAKAAEPEKCVEATPPPPQKKSSCPKHDGIQREKKNKSTHS